MVTDGIHHRHLFPKGLVHQLDHSFIENFTTVFKLQPLIRFYVPIDHNHICVKADFLCPRSNALEGRFFRFIACHMCVRHADDFQLRLGIVVRLILSIDPFLGHRFDVVRGVSYR